MLYGYFKEAAAGRLSLALDDMKRILVKTSFEIIGGKKKALFTNLQTELMASDVDLTDFASRITIFLAEEYQLHKALAIQELQAALNVGKAEAESYSYPSALTAVSEVAAVSQPSARIMTRQQFLSAIRPSAAIYNEWTLREEGDTAYGKKMRAKYFESLNVEALERFFVITGSAGFTSSDLDGIVRHIVEKWSTYNSRSKPDNERFAPYLYFPGISENDLIAMKQSLANDGIEITDGYTFFGSKLDLYSLQQPQTRHRRIAARFLGNQEQMVTILKEMKKNKLIIQLYVNEQEPMPLGYRQIAIPVTSANMIKAIL